MKDNYLPRIVDKIVESRLKDFGAVSIVGCKWCGKSTTGRQFAKSYIELQNTEDNQNILAVAENQPSLILEGDKPRLIDEWQDVPGVWDAIRHDVDKTRLAGQYILTGSSTPRARKPRHSGAGRFAQITMRPMTLFESSDSNGDISLSELLKSPKTISGTSDLDLQSIAYLCTRGGWPISVIRKPSDPFSIAKEYLKIITEREEGFDNVEYYSPGRMRALLRSLSRNISSPVKMTTTIADIAKNTGTSISDTTLANYISILERIHLLDDIEAWSPKIRSKAQIRSSKKRNLADPSLAVASLYANQNDLIMDFNSFGLIYESLALRDLKVYAESIGGDLYYYRDQNGVECDAVIHLDDGNWAGIEIKLGNTDEVIDTAAKSLLSFKNTIDAEVMREPAFLMVLSGISKYAYRRKDGVYVVPIGCLRP